MAALHFATGEEGRRACGSVEYGVKGTYLFLPLPFPLFFLCWKLGGPVSNLVLSRKRASCGGRGALGGGGPYWPLVGA